MRVIICGSRKWKDADAVARRIQALPKDATIVHGACLTGADRFADFYAVPRPLEPHPALWSRHGRKAGPLRNQRMADLGADLCIAFVDRMSGGTWDMVKRARQAAIPVEIIYAEGFDERE